MNTPKFFNKPNEYFQFKHITSNGVETFECWISRSIAVVGVVIVIPFIGEMQILITKRTKKMRDEAGKYCLPCGYLDFGENCFEAMTREVYEETSLYLPDYKEFLIGNNNEKPIGIHDQPTRDKRQNVSMIYLSAYDFHENMHLFPTHVEKYSDKETELVKWMPLSEFYGRYDREYEWAFRHNETIKEVMSHFTSTINHE
jgi:8-oxo-dGTP pyrophosphatase MutT (NUDIX family)